MSGWQTMDSAPKDGSTIVAAGFNYDNPKSGRHLAVVYWNDEAGGWRDRAEGDSNYDYLTLWCSVDIPKLPPPPEQPA
jgi:hypothetical protein